MSNQAQPPSAGSPAAGSPSDASWDVEVLTGPVEPGTAAAVEALAEAAQTADGAPPFSEETLLQLRRSRAGAGSVHAGSEHAGPKQLKLLCVWGPEGASEPARQLLGAAVVVDEQPEHPDAGGELLTELAVHPDHRGSGIGAQLAASLSDTVLPESAAAQHRAWAHGGHPGAPQLAQRFGWSPVRELWRMRLENSVELPHRPLPEGVQLRSFRPGADEQDWLRVNAQAFADHPEQGRLGMEDLAARMAEDWFDPAGFLLAWEGQTLLGFHWTKIHPAEAGERLGEVYVVGISPQAQGRGLGAALTLAGIEHLRSRQVDAVMLYVDAGNTAAVRLYQKLGFTVWTTDVQYAPADQVTPKHAEQPE
ncbi:mycothiol synthase [Nesterenkonia sp.]|uniref:mycothiol synthase n=1 Tax=Nesterenkonia sp. TaxID=704201 RepID=UPI0026327BF0|nr:mycothiol synthase [Nesterenkonia sp.]